MSSVEYLYGLKDLESTIDRSCSISLSDLTITCADAEKIAGRLNGRDVRSLEISRSKFEEGALEILAKTILSIDHCLFISLTKNDIDDRGAKTIVEALKNRNVLGLDLSHNKIEEVGAKAIATALAIHKCAIVSLFHNPIGPKGAEAFARAVCSTYCSKLDLSSTQLGDEGAIKVARILADSSHHIKALRLTDNGISPKGDQALADLLPLKITDILYQTEEVDFKTLSKKYPLGANSIIINCVAKGEALTSLANKIFTIDNPGLINQRNPQKPSFFGNLTHFLSNLFN